VTEVQQAIEMTSISENILSQMMDAFASIISNNLNVVMKFLASMTIVLSLPTIVASIYGMNVDLPLEAHPFAFWYVLGSAVIVSIGEDALKAVPDSYREAGVALGATRWQLVYRVLLPAARNGLLAAVLLGVGRAVGETMAVLMATGHAVHIPGSLLDSVRTLTANIAAELGEAPAGSDHYRVLFLTGTLLFLITFAVNLTADFVIRGVRRK